MLPAKLIEIHCCEQDRYDGKPLYEAIVERCRALKIAGATVLRGVEGYGETAAIHRERLVKHDLPITVLVVDSPEQINALVLNLEQMLEKSVMAMSDVKMRRVNGTEIAAD